jgi:hypothetical protein
MSTSTSLPPLFFDVETEPVRHDTALPRPVVAAFAFGDGPITLASPIEMAEMVAGYAGPVVGHNVAFDLCVLGLGAPASLYDTAIRHTLRGAKAGDPAAADSSLKRAAKQIGIELGGKGTVQLSFRAGQALTEEQRGYVKGDIIATRAVWQAQGGCARSADEERQTSLTLPVFRMAREGVRVDLPRIRKHVAELDVRHGALGAELRDDALIEPRGPKKAPWRECAVGAWQVQRLLREAGATRRATPTSALLAADEEALLATRNPILRRLVEYKGAAKQRSMFAAFDTGEGDVVRAYWKTIVLTGRIACSRPNLTNIPRGGGVRECLLPPEGEVWIDADFPALEMRTWAYACQAWGLQSSLIACWEAGRDPHWEVAAQLLRVPYAEALRHPKGKETRQIAKALNFGLPGGMYPKRLRDHLSSNGFPVGLYAATRYRDQWLKLRPEAEAYWEHCEAVREGEKYRVALPGSGRERLAYQNEARNYPFQGLGADVAKLALVKAQKKSVRVHALVHDQLLSSAPLDIAREVGETLARCMREAGQEVCPTVPWGEIEYSIYPERWVSK